MDGSGAVDLNDLPNMGELEAMIVAHYPLPPGAQLGELALLGAAVKGLPDATVGSLFTRLVVAVTS